MSHSDVTTLQQSSSYAEGYSDQINNRGFQREPGDSDYEAYLQGFEDATDDLRDEANR